MNRTKCITFDKDAQNALPEHIKEKMKADREKSRQGYKQFECVNCIKMSWHHPDERDGIVVGYCEHCGHPIWD